MKALLQRVDKALVTVDETVIGSINKGLVVFVGIEIADTEKDITYLVNKIINLRIFTDANGKFNLSCRDVDGSLLLISQFTLMADTRRGRRPSFTQAAAPDAAEDMFNLFVQHARATGINVETGLFQRHMMVEIHNDGPVTILIDSRDKITSYSSSNNESEVKL